MAKRSSITRRDWLIGSGAGLALLGCGNDRERSGWNDGGVDDVDGAAGLDGAGDPDASGSSDGGVVSSSAWPVQTAAYLSALPRHTGFGMNNFGGGGRHPSNPTPNHTTVLFVDTRATGNTGTISTDAGGNAIGYGTFEWAFRYNPGAGRSKFIVPLVSGVIREIRPVCNFSYVTYCGQAAPGQGLFLRLSKPGFSTGNSHIQVWHLRSYVGDDPGTLAADYRDGMEVGVVSDFCAINCEFAWSMDESASTYSGGARHSWLYCAFIDPLHVPPDFPHSDDPPGTDHGFGPIVGGSEDVASSSFSRCLFAHCTGRNPALYSVPRGAVTNCLLYNYRTGVATSQRTPSTKQLNVVGNMFVRGPDSGSLSAIIQSGEDMAAASHGYGADNVAHGWAYANQAAFFSGAFPTGYRSTTLLDAAWPTGWDAYHRIAEDPQSATAAEKLAFVTLMEQSVGAQPGTRTAGIGRVGTVFSQCKAALSAMPMTSQWIDTVAEAGGWFSPAQTSVDPYDPGTAWHAPLPSGADRDTPLTAGTFADGTSKVGYTPLEVWAIEQHWYKGGK